LGANRCCGEVGGMKKKIALDAFNGVINIIINNNNNVSQKPNNPWIIIVITYSKRRA
jgi:hypothetical protein